MIKNKKGGLGNYLLAYYSYILLILILLGFFFVFTIRTKLIVNNSVTVHSEEINLDTELRNYLNLPVVIDNELWTVSDLILFAFNDECSTKDKPYGGGSYCELLETITRASLGNFRYYKGGQAFGLVISNNGRTWVLFDQKLLEFYELFIPSLEGDISVKFYAVGKDR